MSLNIKDPEAYRLAQAIAQTTGDTMTRVVTEALRERFERIQSGIPKRSLRTSGLLLSAPPPTSSARISTRTTCSTTNTASRNDPRFLSTCRHPRG